jgi:hypothetical protein
VAGIDADVTTVAGISADVTAVAGDATDIGTVAGIAANVTTVAGIAADVTTVAGIDTEVTTLAGLDTEISAIFADLGNLNTKVGKTSDTGAAILPAGTEAERDGSPQAGYLRFNNDTDSFEGYNGTAWGGIGGAQAGGAIVTNKDIASVSYTIATGENGLSVGPVTVDSGVTITVSSGQRWLVL